jgi:hypothetical protein
MNTNFCSVTLTLVGYELRSEELTNKLGIEPSHTDATHLPAHFVSGKVCGGRECGLWSYETAAAVTSADVGEHIRHLVRTFHPLKSRIEEFVPALRTFVHARCPSISRAAQSPMLSPRIEADCLAGLAELGAVLSVELINQP